MAPCTRWINRVGRALKKMTKTDVRQFRGTITKCGRMQSGRVSMPVD